jgi:hypothetical protein
MRVFAKLGFAVPDGTVSARLSTVSGPVHINSPSRLSSESDEPPFEILPLLSSLRFEGKCERLTKFFGVTDDDGRGGATGNMLAG